METRQPKSDSRQRTTLVASTLAATVLLSVACSTNPQLHHKNTLKGLPFDQPSASDSNNEDALAYYKDVEWPLHRVPDQPPRLGVSLSGGGIRSAVFSLGVLTALHRVGLFPSETDIVSAVSGGGYIASWFMGQQVLSPETDVEKYFETKSTLAQSNEETPQGRLHAEGKFILLRKNPRLWGYIVGTLGGIFPNIVANAAWGLHSNTSPHRRYYENRIAQVFLSYPDGPRTPSVEWRQIDERIRQAQANSQHLPNLILNARADYGVGEDKARRAGYNSIYEFTPQRFGNDGLGFICLAGSGAKSACKRHYSNVVTKAPLTLERAAAISGAAFDSSVIDRKAPGQIPRMLVSSLNFDLGYWMTNPDREGKGCWKRIFPGIYKAFKIYRPDRRGCRFLLTDGGHSENLGLYSLVRRAPSAVIVVDAVHDPNMTFSSYRKVRELLLTDLNVVVNMSTIDQDLPIQSPVMRGNTSAIPLSERPARSISLAYIKLPARSHVDSQCRAREYNRAICSYFLQDEDFPHNSTLGDQSYAKEQFLAYRELGIAVAEEGMEVILAAVCPSMVGTDRPPIGCANYLRLGGAETE